MQRADKEIENETEKYYNSSESVREREREGGGRGGEIEKAT